MSDKEPWEYVAFYDGARAYDMIRHRIEKPQKTQKSKKSNGASCPCLGGCDCHELWGGGEHPGIKCKDLPWPKP